MPGIFGAISQQGRSDARRVGEAMHATLLHQDWYAHARWSRDDAYLGALSTSPHFDAARHLAGDDSTILLLEGNALTIDGEIPDPDVDAPAARLLSMYHEDGDDFIRRVSGQFNLVIYQEATRTVTLMNDRLGFSHMYWSTAQGRLLFAPELKAFLADPDLNRDLDEHAVALFFCHDGLVGDRTFLEPVRMLPPGSRLRWQDGRASVERYWRPEYDPDARRATGDFVDEGQELYRRSLAKRLPADRYARVHLPLTGGLDSRLMLRLLSSRDDGLTLHTHGHEDCLDWRFARRVSTALGVADRHRLIPYTPELYVRHSRLASWLNDGQVSFRNAPLVGISEALEPGPIPFVNGILGAYLSLSSGNFHRRRDIRTETDEDALRRRVMQARGLPAAHQLFELFLEPATARRWRDLSREMVWDEFQHHRHHELLCDQLSSLTHLNLGRRMQSTIDLHRYYFHDLLPFVDEDLFALNLRIPAQMKMNHSLYQEMMKRHFPELAALPWAHTGCDLHASAEDIHAVQSRRLRANRWRQRASRLTWGRWNPRARDDYQHRKIWLREHAGFREEVLTTVRQAQATELPWFDAGRIDHLLRRYDAGRYYYWDAIARLYTFLTWHRLFMREGHLEENFASVGKSGLPAETPISTRAGSSPPS